MGTENTKYEITNETIEFEGVTLHRIKALKDFGDVNAGDLGGYVESEANLSQLGNCWVGDEAKVYGKAYVCDNVIIENHAIIREKALITGDCVIDRKAIIEGKATCQGNVTVTDHAYIRDAEICHRVLVCGEAKIFDGYFKDDVYIEDKVEIYGGRFSDDVVISGKAKIYGRPWAMDNVKILGNAIIYGSPSFYDRALISGNALVYGESIVRGNANVKGNAVVCEYMNIENGNCTTDLRKSLEESIRCQTGLVPINGEVIAYKTVMSDLTSIHDRKFKYEIGKWAEVEFYDDSIISCAEGLHFSNANYWDENLEEGCVILAARIKLEDIITVQAGKIRCKKAFILGSYDPN